MDCSVFIPQSGVHFRVSVVNLLWQFWWYFKWLYESSNPTKILFIIICQMFMLQAHLSIPGHVTFSMKSMLTSQCILFKWKKTYWPAAGESQGENTLCNDITDINQSEHSNVSCLFEKPPYYFTKGIILLLAMITDLKTH